MTLTNIKLIFLRELKDQIRDRRTLFMVLVLPMLLYPALGIGMVNMTQTLSRQIQRIVVVGSEEMPEPGFLTADGTVDPRLLDTPADADALAIVTDEAASLEQVKDPGNRQELVELAESVRGDIRNLSRLSQLQSERKSQSALTTMEAMDEEERLRKDLDGRLARSAVQVLVVFPPGFRRTYDEISSALAAGQSGGDIAARLPQPMVFHNSADEKSEIAFKRLRPILNNWEDRLLERRLADAGLPVTLPDPVPLATIDLAKAEQLAANIWSKMFPALLVIMSVTGAFYPAIDLGAGEKERGTMETLLISPATRSEIVLGKFLTVLLFSLTSALLNLASMGFTGHRIHQAVASAKAMPGVDLTAPSFGMLACVVLVAIPLAALFSALSLSLAMFAKSSKEGQYYLTPLLLVSLGLTVFCMYPGVELSPFYSVLPVIGPALLLKTVLMGNIPLVSIGFYVFPVLIMSGAYCGIALWWAIELFQREDVLFRESERFELGTWLRHLLREKEATPSYTEAGFCFVLIVMLQFLFFTSVQNSPGILDGPRKLVTVQLLYLIATVGVPPVMMALLLTSNFLRTLKLSWPDPRMLGAAVVLGFTLQPLALELLSRMEGFFPPPPAGVEQVIAAMSTDAVPVWLSLAAFALAPAVCEELAFRGFILSGLERARRKWLPIVISALLFGVIHLIPKQQFNATLLGLVIGLLAVRSGSLLPGVVFHFIFNGTQVLAGRMADSGPGFPGVGWFVRVQATDNGPSVTFTPLLLGMCGALSAMLIFWLIRQTPRRQPIRDSLQSTADQMSVHAQ